MVYNLAINYLDENQGFSKLGNAKGSKDQQFKTLSMRTWVKQLSFNCPAKLIHSSLQRAWVAWKSTKYNKKLRKRVAEKFKGNFTLETDPSAYKKGVLYPKFWGKLPPITLIHNHLECSIIGSNCLTIYRRFGRWYLSQPNEWQRANPVVSSPKIIALDPGLRNFMTGFDGKNWYQFTDPSDAQRLAKIAKYRDKLTSQKKRTKRDEHRRKIAFKMSRLNRKLLNLKRELHRKLAVYLASNFNVVFIPDFKTKQIFTKKKNNKTNNKTSRWFSHYEFRSLLAYHCAKNGSVMVTVNEAYSSKTCSKCGLINKKLGSKKRFICSCGHSLDRDLNGAVNILHNSLALSQGGLGC